MKQFSLKATLLAALMFIAMNGLAMTVLIAKKDGSCGNPTGEINAAAFGGTPPYTYQWSTGETTPMITGLTAGQYTVTATDANMETASETVTIDDHPYLWVVDQVGTSYFQTAQDEVHLDPCPGVCNGGLIVWEHAFNGQAPYTITSTSGSFAGVDFFYQDPVYTGFCWGETVSFDITDAYGCQGTLQTLIYGPIGNTFSIDQILGACNGNNGQIQVSVNLNDQQWWSGAWILEDPGLALIDYQQNNGASNVSFTGLAPGQYILRTRWDNVADDCYEDLPFTVPDLGPDCGILGGTLYYDHDNDCTQDPEDIGIPFQVFGILPGQQLVISDGNGQYNTNLSNGTYDLVMTDPLLDQNCPTTFTMASASMNVDVAANSLVDLDLEVGLVNGPARPGFQSYVGCGISNLSGQLSGPIIATLTLDSEFIFLSAMPPPSNVSGNVITWNVAELNAFQIASLSVQVELPPDPLLIGQALVNSFSASTAFTETDLLNNTINKAVTVTASFDPNDKLAMTSSGYSNEYFYIDQDEWIDYTIRFQNTGTDTAFTVVITDTLNAELDMASFEQGLASHPFSVSFKPDRVVEWRFENILLPDSNVNEAASHGLVSFRIKPHLPILPGTEIENVANIYFDFNEPVITDPSVLVATMSTGIPNHSIAGDITLFPQPTKGEFQLIGLDPSIALHELRIFSIEGRMILDQRVAAGQRIFDLGILQNGQYVVELLSAHGPIARKPLLIMR